MKLRAVSTDALSGAAVACLDPSDAMEIGVKENERMHIVGPKSEVTVFTILSEKLIEPGTVAVPSGIMKRIGASEGDILSVTFNPSPESVRSIRRKMDGLVLDPAEISAVVKDIYGGNLSGIEVSAWLTALYINGMNIDEIAAFAVAMVDTGDRVKFDRSPVFDFHSMGGVPGNKITPIVVSIVAAAGLMIPKTSSRAISSACGTSDFVELFCPVEVDAQQLSEIGENVGGAFVWGGSMNIAPVDDIVIKIEHPLGINPRAQMLASIISKKLAIGAQYLLVDIPTGSGTKVKTLDEARAYARDFMDLGDKLGIHIECAITYADQPIGSAVGPALEARECLRILEGYEHPASVIEKACECAGIVLEMGGFSNGVAKAHEILSSGAALKKFKEIVAAQGGNPDQTSEDIPLGQFTADIAARQSGYVHSIDNKEVVAIAKALGAPTDKGAGMLLLKKKGQRVEQGDVLFQLFADNKTKLDRAKDLAERYNPVRIEGMLLKHVTAIQPR
ncbi:putative thymidine phosphorylase/AMP phosphorylase [Thermoplasmatales archaeon BRNA1]|nr:putative thymidine phosphorylase/AMP phosphorylase [Thermoplasmatales archaeon BRNA1]